MKRVQAACICQTLHFFKKDDGSIVINVIKQYNNSPVGDYLKYERET